MNNTPSRVLLPPLMLEEFYEHKKCPNLKNTLEHANALITQYFDDNEEQHYQSAPAELYETSNYRIIRDAKNTVSDNSHPHIHIPICWLKPPPDPVNFEHYHMPFQDFTIVLQEGDSETTHLVAQKVFNDIRYITTFLRQHLGVPQILGCSAKINAIIHYNKNYANAFWDGQAIYFGDGDNDEFNPFYLDIDIIAHELSHGLVSSTAKLTYRNQSGALNESIADVIGIMVKQYVRNEDVFQSNWLIAENLFKNKCFARGLRSMSNPGSAYYFPYSRDNQTCHMYYYNNTSKDNGGVHINSGIPNRAFYFLATALRGYSWERAGKIWIAALLDKDTGSESQFVHFAQQTVKHAERLYGNSVRDITIKSWYDVGIYI